MLVLDVFGQSTKWHFFDVQEQEQKPSTKLRDEQEGKLGTISQRNASNVNGNLTP